MTTTVPMPDPCPLCRRPIHPRATLAEAIDAAAHHTRAAHQLLDQPSPQRRTALALCELDAVLRALAGAVDGCRCGEVLPVEPPHWLQERAELGRLLSEAANGRDEAKRGVAELQDELRQYREREVEVSHVLPVCVQRWRGGDGPNATRQLVIDDMRDGAHPESADSCAADCLDWLATVPVLGWGTEPPPSPTAPIPYPYPQRDRAFTCTDCPTIRGVPATHVPPGYLDGTWLGEAYCEAHAIERGARPIVALTPPLET